jgi:segregation and condensation protein B
MSDEMMTEPLCLSGVKLKSLIEALLFDAGEGYSRLELCAKLRDSFSAKEVERALAELKAEYSGDRGIILIEYGNKYQFQTHPDLGGFLKDILVEKREKEVSKTLLTVLSIIAYRQPITRSEIEKIRGVSSDYAVAILLQQNLIEPQGRKESLGNPVLYGTTDDFLKKFGIQSVKDLPDYENLMAHIRNNFDKYHKKTTDLYRERSFSEDGEEIPADSVAAAVAPEDVFIEEDAPEHLEGEEFVEVESQ